ncbi:hypothetical protein C1X30_31355, partial [Pseudomonas sp. FW305-BF6]|uniref:hypothetical protein n=1 Tax=Pseudomonas sp. FW305-BF6 TaxID=2070673 RepID=UPI000CB3B894
HLIVIAMDTTKQLIQASRPLVLTPLEKPIWWRLSNQLTAWSGASLLYDANGNMTSDAPGTARRLCIVTKEINR